MEKIVVISCSKYSISFEKKLISLSEGDTVPLRRALQGERVTKNNGLFYYPKHIKECKLSRNHAKIICNDSKIYLKAINRNTFINSRRVELGEAVSIIKDGDKILLGGFRQNTYDSVVAKISVFSSEDEDYKYFCKLEMEYPFLYQFPESPPQQSVKTEDLYAVTLERLEVLRHLSRFGENELNSTRTIKMVTESLETRNYVDLLKDKTFYSDYKRRYEFMKSDQVAQFILAVAFCGSKRLNYWFINQERKLFILMWFKMFPQEQVDFLAKHHMDYEEVPHTELVRLSSLHDQFFLESMKYYKVHFTEAPTLLKRRNVFVSDGVCYLKIEHMYAPVVEQLERTFLQLLQTYRANLPNIWWDGRIKSIILFVEQTIGTNDRYRSSKEAVTERSVRKLCEESFPLCMKVLQFYLSRDHHLRNGGRFQYTLFLKGIGLSLLNSLVFWKAHFTKKIEESVFLKRYSYHIRHAYGTEGKMADYSPQNCSDILKAVPGPLEYHGCPFKVLDAIRMKEALNRSGIERKDHTKILELMEKGNPQEACKLYFNLTHNVDYPYETVVHPNIYYDASRKVRLRQRDRIKVKFDERCNNDGECVELKKHNGKYNPR